MDIAKLSTALSTAQLSNQVSVAVLDKTMENNEAAGAGLLKMMDAAAMERSVNPNIGANFDMSV